ncbi:MAG TPA: L-2-hydroxyglutarate oxidase [Baekduia sp.]|uniref:L-2-hydroxyglutarate oxidase n=1 Tax=Baekduia sp. TaxID=2600305 RepID=UPI002BF684C4|nr:L-2-hydroxyglutarate oxidase [Baekduia sp.]HMJ36138.1 L-2-hydroxyglutarate oxidase [Baekduia sp.]
MTQADPSGECDVAVVGGGIIGLATARELQRRRPDARIVVLEREDAVGRHQTGSNSGVAHAGIYYAPGSLKAQLCVEGVREMYAFCEEHDIAHERCGKVIVALERSELAGLDTLEARGRANGVPGLRRIGPAELAEIEPHAAGIAALHSPDTGIVDFGAVARALAAQLEAGGAVVATGAGVTAISRDGGPGGAATRVVHARGELRARRVLTCAGAWSDRVAVAAGADPDPRIVPFRGGYLRLAPEARHLVRGLIYPVPNPELPFLGVHLTRRVDGEVLLGPTALLVGARDAYTLTRVRGEDLRATLAWPGTWRMMRRWWRTGLTELHLAASRRALVAACARYVPAVGPGDVEPGPAGIRAQAVARDGALVDDFVVHEAGGAIHVRNAPSPAATSSLALARLIADRVAAAG